MSLNEKLNKIWNEYIDEPKNIEKLKSDSEAVELIIEDLFTIFDSKKSSYFSKITELLNLFVQNLGIPFMLLLNKTPLLKSILEIANNTIKKLSSNEKKSFIEIWKYFLSRFTLVSCKFNEINDFSQFYDLNLLIKNEYPDEIPPKDSIKLTEYERLFLEILEKNLKAEQILNKITAFDKKRDFKLLTDQLQILNTIDLSEFFNLEAFSQLEIYSLISLGKKTESLKEKIRLFDKSFESLLYGQEKTLHNQEFYEYDAEFPMKNNLQTHFLDSLDHFYNQFSNMQKLVCGFLNAKGGRIYVGVIGNRIKGYNLTKKEQDDIRLQTDETSRGFHPLVQAEEFRTHFYPIIDTQRKFTGKFIVKIVINPNFKEVYFTPKPTPFVFLRKEDGKEELCNEKQWQTLYLNKKQMDKNAIEKIEDPLPIDEGEIIMINQKKPIYNHQYFDPTIEKEQRLLNKHFYEKDLEKKLKDTINFKEHDSKKNKGINILNDYKENNVKKYNDNLLHNVLVFKYNHKISEKSFLDSTRAIAEHLNEVYGDLPKFMIRRKEKRSFFIERSKEINEEDLRIIRKIYAEGDCSDLEFNFANEENYQKYKDYLISQ